MKHFNRFFWILVFFTSVFFGFNLQYVIRSMIHDQWWWALFSFTACLAGVGNFVWLLKIRKRYKANQEFKLAAKLFTTPMLMQAQTLGWPDFTMSFPDQLSHDFRELEKLVPGFSSTVMPCPCGGCFLHGTLRDMIVHLNDRHAWSREQIANWLEYIPMNITIQAAPKGN